MIHSASYSRTALRASALSALLVLPLLAGCDLYGDGDGGDPPPPGAPVATVVAGAGDITATVDEFRALLGEPNNGATPGQQPDGRREINWDGAPPPLTNTDDFPGDVFNTASPRGAEFTTPGTGFRVSDNDFSDVNADYEDEFNDFSPDKTFMAVGSNEIDARFFVAGSDTSALVRGFGVVFSDVDELGAATLAFYDADDALLGTYEAPARADAAGLSFLGVAYDARVVYRVRITAGEAALGADVYDVSDGGTHDLVVTDDFLYDEPQTD
jgi:hypothetical protein